MVCNNLFKYNDIEAFSRLRFIQLTSAGMDRVPLEYIMSKGIHICNAKGVYDIPIAEYTVGRILEWYKRFRDTDLLMADRKWEKQRGLQELSGKTAIIFGYGGIGREIARRLRAFNVRIIAVSRTERLDESMDLWCGPETMVDMLDEADIFICTVPLTGETRGVIDYSFLSRFKASSILVNVSRGGIVKTKDLIRALKNRMLAGAILDVYEKEPLSEDSELWNMENVLLSPHNSFEGEGNKTRLEKLIEYNIKREGLCFEKGRNTTRVTNN